MTDRSDEYDPTLRETEDQSAPTEAPATGRARTVDDSPEGDLMQVGTIASRDADPLAEGNNEGGVDDVDDRAANEARMAVRKQEHSAD
jgi:hypothetical protein